MNRNRKPEILSPAGNPEKLYYALLYGADAVYCALDKFGMRSQAGNFTPEQLDEGVKYAHSLGKKVYITLNTMPRDNDLPLLEDYLRVLKEIGPDAYIVSDPGVICKIKEIIPEGEIHLSTQASTVNSAACRFWHSAGIKRIVLARELTLENIKAVRENTPPELEIECFVHGAMCVSYSGRCLLSHYYINRNANDGSCAQPCRWKYYMYEEKRECDKIEAVQDDTGTYVFSSKDMCMIEHIPELIDAGIDSLKIEGRMKSAYYTAAVTNAYRMALDDYFAGKPFNKDYLTEVESVSHREYCTGFYFNSPQENANIVNNNEYLKDRAYLCTVSDYDSEKGMALCLQRNKMSVGENVQILSPGKVGRDAVINELYDVDGNPIESTPHAKMEFYLKAEGLKKGDIIRGK